MEGEKDERHFEVKESDEHFMPEVVIDDQPGSELKALLDDNGDVVQPEKEVKVRYAARVPGPVTRMKAGEFELDPVTNIYVRKVVEVVPEPVKKVRKPRAPKVVEVVQEKVKKPKVVKEKQPPVKKVAPKKVPVKKVAAPAKKAPAKKVATKKSATIPEMKLKPLARAKKAAEVQTTKKVPAKKTASKKAK
jgi:hypothetical protein